MTRRGLHLSIGQGQCSVVRCALCHHANPVISDEATSALDNPAESVVMAAIDALPGDTSVVMTAYRLSTVKRCHRIATMKLDGMVVTTSRPELRNNNACE